MYNIIKHIQISVCENRIIQRIKVNIELYNSSSDHFYPFFSLGWIWCEMFDFILTFDLWLEPFGLCLGKCEHSLRPCWDLFSRHVRLLGSFSQEPPPSLTAPEILQRCICDVLEIRCRSGTRRVRSVSAPSHRVTTEALTAPWSCTIWPDGPPLSLCRTGSRVWSSTEPPASSSFW